jgi:hypothetical protein
VSGQEARERARAIFDAATPRPWVNGYVWLAGCMERLGPDTCSFCAQGGEPVWRGEADINGTMMRAHRHRVPDPDGHTITGADFEEVAGNYDYEEGGIIRPEDTALILLAVNDYERAVAEAATLREAAERMHREYIKASFHPDANDERGRWHRADRAAGALRAVLVAGREPT